MTENSLPINHEVRVGSLHPLSQFSSVQFSCSVVTDYLRPHESQHARPPCPSQKEALKLHVCWHASLNRTVLLKSSPCGREMTVITFEGWLKYCCCYSLKLCTNGEKHFFFLSPLSQYCLSICKESCKCLLKSSYIFNNIVFDGCCMISMKLWWIQGFSQ